MEASAGAVTQEERHTTEVFSPPSFCGACLRSSNVFIARRIQPFLSLSSSTVKSNFLYPRHNNRSPPLILLIIVGHDVRENPSSCDCAEIRTHVPTSEGFEVTN